MTRLNWFLFVIFILSSYWSICAAIDAFGWFHGGGLISGLFVLCMYAKDK